MRVLVTGGHGFIGRHVVDALLAHGFRVRCLNRRPARPASLEGVDVEVVAGDLRAPDSLRAAVASCDHVVHLAGLTRALTRTAMRATNTDGTLALYDAAARAGLPGRFLYCSSQAAAGPAPTPEPIDEQQAADPALSWYGQSKRAAEVALLARRGGPRLAILRPPAVYGPRDTDFLTLFQAVSRGIVPVLGDPRTAYSLIYAGDLAAAFLRALEQDTAPGPYFVTHPDVVTGEALVAAAEFAVGRSARRFVLPVSTLRVVGRMADLISQLSGRASLMGTQRMREVAARHWVCRGDAFEQAADWRAAVGLTEGFARTVAWYRETNALSKLVR